MLIGSPKGGSPVVLLLLTYHAWRRPVGASCAHVGIFAVRSDDAVWCATLGHPSAEHTTTASSRKSDRTSAVCAPGASSARRPRRRPRRRCRPKDGRLEERKPRGAHGGGTRPAGACQARLPRHARLRRAVAPSPAQQARRFAPFAVDKRLVAKTDVASFVCVEAQRKAHGVNGAESVVNLGTDVTGPEWFGPTVSIHSGRNLSSRILFRGT